jgi:hypothetical protein
MRYHPPIQMIIEHETSNPHYRDVYLGRYYQQRWTTKKLFTIGIVPRESQISPDRKWYYLASTDRGTFLCNLRRPKPERISEEMFNCRFSPDSRFLLGTSHFRGGLVAFDLSRATLRELHSCSAKWTSYESSWSFGWYPDGRACWYRDPSGVYFRVFVGSWRRQRLSAGEAKRIELDWDLLDPRLRYSRYFSNADPKLHRPKTVPEGYYTYIIKYAYSWNRRFRLRATGYRRDLPPVEVLPPEITSDFRHELVLESRDGRSQILVRPGDHPHTAEDFILPRAVSNDGQWALWSTLNTLVLLETSTAKKQSLPEEIPGIGRHREHVWVGEMWFDE